MFNLDGDGDLGGSDISDDPDITRFKYVYSILFIYKEVPIPNHKMNPIAKSKPLSKKL